MNYLPSEGDCIVYSDNEIFIVWNGSFTFNVYTLDDLYEIDVFTNYNIDGFEEAQGTAYDWADNYNQVMTEAEYNA